MVCIRTSGYIHVHTEPTPRGEDLAWRSWGWKLQGDKQTSVTTTDTQVVTRHRKHRGASQRAISTSCYLILDRRWQYRRLLPPKAEPRSGLNHLFCAVAIVGYETVCEEAEPLWVMQQHRWAEPESLWVIKKKRFVGGARACRYMQSISERSFTHCGVLYYFIFLFLSSPWGKVFN